MLGKDIAKIMESEKFITLPRFIELPIIVKDKKSSELDNNLIDFLRAITKHEPNHIDIRYWFIGKKIGNLTCNYY